MCYLVLEWRTTFEIYVVAEVESPWWTTMKTKPEDFLKKKRMLMAGVFQQWVKW